MRRPLPAATLRRFALAQRCLRAAGRSGGMRIDTLAGLMDGAVLVELQPEEFARFALAVAAVRWQRERAVRV